MGARAIAALTSLATVGVVAIAKTQSWIAGGSGS